jgi:hypothetical protein
MVLVGIKTTGEQISILCHNGTIFDNPREKTGLAIKTRFFSKFEIVRQINAFVKPDLFF